ncbi:helix-turn-helix domain-containing protein [Streptomyces sp. NPDC087219]|uniref:helix-turn-helix domain-containing protein n=1 Tax=Streptomyces sp. NPDC087219 TaxID=3365770 RepID=UPI003809850D
MTAAEDFAHRLRQLRTRVGAPSVRQLSTRTGYGKSTISEAFAGRRLPTWALVEKLSEALGADAEEFRDQWAAAKDRPGNAAMGWRGETASVADWLTSVRIDIPDLVTERTLEEACAAAVSDPERALHQSWEVLRVGALQISNAYDDTPGDWSSNIVATYGRAEQDGLLAAGARNVANAVHYYYVGSRAHPREIPSTAALLQIAVLAYRLAWQARDLIEAKSSDSAPAKRQTSPAQLP